MDGQDFDRWLRTVTSGATRRTIFAGVIGAASAALAAFSGEEVGAKKKPKPKGKCTGNTKKCGTKCIPKSSCCTSADCGSGKQCKSGRCVCTPDCEDKECGDDGCGGICGSCSAGQCDAGRCSCAPDCEDKECGSDGCGGSCGTCGSGYCHQNQCICEFGSTTCRTNFCCPIEQACIGDGCEACPETPDLCAVEIVCGRTTARFPQCYCVTSLDDVTTCSSIFATEDQTTDCTSDADCEGLLDPEVEMVCININAPCPSLPGVRKVCVNKGCEDLNARLRSSSGRGASTIRQLRIGGRE